MYLHISILLLLATTALLSTTKPLTLRPPGEPSECALSLVALPPSLCYIAGPPNHVASAPSDICSSTFYQTIMTTGPSCVCYLVRDPLVLGFPIDTGRLVAMFPSCEVNNNTTAVRWLYDTCRGINPSPTPCLSYIAGTPNRAASAPSDICCGTFYQTIMTAGPACACYLVRGPLILGFPIDNGRLVAMFPSCEVNNNTTAVRWLYDTCRGINPVPTPCRSYIAGPPNRAASAPSDICYGTFYQTIMTAGPACVCYLVRDPLILGFPIDTGRLVAMFPSCEVNNTATAVRWLYDSSRVSTLPSTAPLPAAAKSNTPVCPYLRWRRHLHSEDSKELKYAIYYWMLLLTNSLNWILILRYDVDYKGQSYMYFISLIISSIPVFLVPSSHFGPWESVSLGTGIVCTAFSIMADIAVYRHFGHLRMGLGFAFLEAIGATVVRIFGVKATHLVQMISSASNLASILILIVCILCNTRWDYIRLEVFTAFLSAVYTALDLIYACDTPNTVILGVAVLIRILYGLLLLFRSHTRGILVRIFCRSNVAEEQGNGAGQGHVAGDGNGAEQGHGAGQGHVAGDGNGAEQGNGAGQGHVAGEAGNGVEQDNVAEEGNVARTRRLRSWGEIWQSLMDVYVTPIRNSVQNAWNSLWELLQKAWTSFLLRVWRPTTIATKIKSCMNSLFTKVTGFWSAIPQSQGQGQGQGQRLELGDMNAV